MPRWAPPVALAVASIVLGYPAFRALFMLDDFLHASMLNGTWVVDRQPWDLYSFVDDSDREILRLRGLVPWWTHPDLTIRFFRPLSALLLWVDHQLIGDDPLWMHVHSGLWLIATIGGAWLVYQRAFSRRVAWIATFVYALAPAHTMPIAWLANRDALISLGLGLPGIWAHVRWREEKQHRFAALATLLFSLSLAGGEYAIGLGGFVLAFELLRREDGLVRRALSLATFAVPALVYLAIRRELDYGTVGSGFYSDPLHSPGLYLAFAPRHFAMLVLDAWLTLDQVTLSWAFPNWALAIGFVAVAAPIGVVVWRTLRDAEPRAGHTARWLLVGSWIALVPVLAVVPAPRVLGASILGVAPCVALVLDAMWFPAAIVDRATLPLRERRYAELAALVAIALGYLHLVHGPATAWLMNRHFRDSSLAYEAQLESMRRLAGDVPGSEIVVVRGMAGSFFAPFAAGPRGAPPVRYYMLSQSSHVLVLRTGERSFDMIGPTDGGVFPLGEGNLYRDLTTPVAEGDTFELPGLRATIVQMSGAWARRVRFEFDEDVDLEDLVWLNENRKGYLSATLPDVGFGRPFDFER